MTKTTKVGGWRGEARDWSLAMGARGREKSLSDLVDTDAVTPAGAPSLPEGREMYLFPTNLRVAGEILGLVRAAASLSLESLKVLLGTRQSDGTDVWWNYSVGAIVAGHYNFR